MSEYRDNICTITADVWSQVLGAVVLPREGEPVAVEGEHTVAGYVHITGAWEGSVALHCATPLARQAAARMFGVTAEEASTDETQDAVGELANMTGGNLKALFPEPCHLSLPVVVVGTDYATRLPGSHVVDRVAFECEGAPLQVTLLAREPSPAR